ncbi:alginate lyase-domain-containing protein [Coprinopsis sp. MPI-PUGE-AT-0042]|nr:alginate lyase-domain-containing protein [Coprinopsis sp. MPI-PUGE-AT-0042]
MRSCSPRTLFLLTFFHLPLFAASQTSYANEFVDPDWVLTGNFPDNTQAARDTIVKWASQLANEGPWSVMSKDATPPSGDKHDYMSWAPYWWPDCSEVDGAQSLTETEVWTTCPYVRRDGQFNPDVRRVNDVGSFQTMSDAIFYSALAWAFDKPTYALLGRNAVTYIRTWFLDDETRMNPHLEYAQQIRGLDGVPGAPTGVLTWRRLLLRSSSSERGESTDWTPELDDKMVAWSNEYIQWLETAELALEERSAANTNHGTFYYNQLAAMTLIANDIPGAINVTTSYFSQQYLTQITAEGEQPFETARTRPYHYRAYNLAAMIINAKIEKYVDPSSDVWERTSSTSATIKTALDFAMQFNPSDTDEAHWAAELYPAVVAVASIFGDPDGKYLAFMKKAEPQFHKEPYFFLYAGEWSADVAVPKSPSRATGKVSPTGISAVNAEGAGARTSVGLMPLVPAALSAMLTLVIPVHVVEVRSHDYQFNLGFDDSVIFLVYATSFPAICEQALFDFEAGPTGFSDARGEI